MDNVPIILLAAGGSTRMGQPKQLLPWGNQTLVEHQINKLINTGSPVYVVLGANANLVLPVVKKYNVTILMNLSWEKGMGGSIVTGIDQISKSLPTTNGVLITLLDQPLITSNHLMKMLSTFQPGSRNIIVSQSASGWKGVPALFDKCYFDELKKLDGEEGAKIIIQKYEFAVTSVECGDQVEDMDSPEAYQKMLNKFISRY